MTLAVSIAQSGANNVTMRNRIINGSMVFDQRNAGASVSRGATDNVYTLDRWNTRAEAADGVYTVQRVADAPAGFVNSLKVTVTTADASVGASQVYAVNQTIEGYNVADLSFGSANAKTITVSFWVKSTLTGSFGASVTNGSGSNRSYPFLYTISSANTWEYKTATISGDQSGTWTTDNTGGMMVNFAIGTGSSEQGTVNTWNAGLYRGATGQTQVISTLNATIQWTGVQLEAGTTATAFEQRLYGTELALCQRYYWAIGRLPFTGNTNYTHIGSGTAISNTRGYVIVPMPVSMRSSPSLSVIGATTFNAGQGGLAVTSIAADVLGVNSASLDFQWAAGGTFSLNSACRLYTGPTNAEIQFSAEL